MLRPLRGRNEAGQRPQRRRRALSDPWAGLPSRAARSTRPWWWWRPSATASTGAEANASPTPAMARASRASPRPSRLARQLSRPVSTAPGFRPCCQLARRAMRSTARCGTSRRRSRDEARPSLPDLRRCMPSRPPSPSRSAAPRRWRPARARRRAIPCSSSSLAAMATRRRLAAIRDAVPKARLIADANEAWRASDLERLLAAAKAAGVELIEQPLPAGDDAALAAHRPHRPGLRRRVGA